MAGMDPREKGIIKALSIHTPNDREWRSVGWYLAMSLDKVQHRRLQWIIEGYQTAMEDRSRHGY